MISFITASTHGYTISALSSGNHAGAPACRSLSYETLFLSDTLPGGTYVFTDIERLSAAELSLAAVYFRALGGQPGFRMLNDPARVKTRYGLLRSLREAGLNDFDAYRADGHPRPERFPVFVRAEASHDAALTGLIGTQAELDAELIRLVGDGHPLRGLIVIEYCAQPVLPGVFRRWGGFVIAGEPHLDHAVQEDHWNVKWGTAGLTLDETFVELATALRENRFADVLRPAFEVACIDYGRADFGFVGGRPQVWEINTNPYIGPGEPHRSRVWEEALRFAADRLDTLMSRINIPASESRFVVEPSAFPETAQTTLALYRQGRAPAAIETSETGPSADPAPQSAIEAEVFGLRNEVETLRIHIAAVQASTSWRATAPLRVATNGLRRVRPASLSRRRNDPVAGTAAICMLRNCADIVPFLCGHYLRLGFERVVFVDDQSDDGTFAFLRALARRQPRIRVSHVGERTRRQVDVMTEAANEAIAGGCRLVVPFDADEFWATDRDKLAILAADPTPRIIFGDWVTFLQNRDVVAHRPGSLFRVRHSVASDTVSENEIVTFRAPFSTVPNHKAAFVSDAPVDFEAGQHALASGPTLVDRARLELFHLPFRNRAEIVKRAIDYEPRRLAFRTSSGESWQSAFHAEAHRVGRIDEVWAANSVDRRGIADVYGQPTPAIRDERLKRLLAAASFHMFRHYGLLVR